MSALLDFAAEVRAVCEERDSLRKARADATAELRSMQRDRDILRESVKAWQEAEATARGRWQEEHIKCDQARAELAGVAAQRDAHLSRSVELAARVTKLEAKTFDVARLEQDNAGLRNALASEVRKTFDMRAAMDALEARLATVTPAVDKVDGFRVGDLVRWTNAGRRRDASWHPVEKIASPIVMREFERKPVEVGDMVRITGGSFAGHAGIVQSFFERTATIQESADSFLIANVKYLVAIAPTVKP